MGGMGGDGGFDFSNVRFVCMIHCLLYPDLFQYMSNMGGAGGGPPNMDDFGDDSDNEGNQ
jgi:hypothetical protein